MTYAQKVPDVPPEMPPEMAPAEITIDGLGIQRDGRWLLHGFDLHVEPGRKVVLTGPSGCGKTTLLHCLLGFVQPDCGRIAVGGVALGAETVWALRRRIGYVAQEPDLGCGSVRRALDRPFHYRANRSLVANLERLPDYMAQFALPQTLLDKDITELSGGEKQRVALIAAFLLQRDVLLLDEITSALDRDRRGMVLWALRDHPATMLIVSHDQAVFDMADHVVTLQPAGADR